MTGILDTEQIEAVLHSGVIGRIGCKDDARVYIVPINYVYDGKNIIAHSTAGKKIQMMRNSPWVCFEVEELKSATNWKTVIVQGIYQEIADEKERYDAMKLFVDRMLHLKISETAIPPEMADKRQHPRSPGNINLVVYRILVNEKTGRFEAD